MRFKPRQGAPQEEEASEPKTSQPRCSLPIGSDLTKSASINSASLAGGEKHTSLASRFKQHIFVKSFEKPSLCRYPGCKKGFMRKISLDRHANHRHGEQEKWCLGCRQNSSKIRFESHQEEQVSYGCREAYSHLLIQPAVIDEIKAPDEQENEQAYIKSFRLSQSFAAPSFDITCEREESSPLVSRTVGEKSATATRHKWHTPDSSAPSSKEEEDSTSEELRSSTDSSKQGFETDVTSVDNSSLLSQSIVRSDIGAQETTDIAFLEFPAVPNTPLEAVALLQVDYPSSSQCPFPTTTTHVAPALTRKAVPHALADSASKVEISATPRPVMRFETWDPISTQKDDLTRPETPSWPDTFFSHTQNRSTFSPAEIDAWLEQSSMSEKRWKALQLEAIFKCSETLSSVHVRVQDQYASAPALLTLRPNAICTLCQKQLGHSHCAVLQHMNEHVKSRPKPSSRCSEYSISFLLKADYLAHLQCRARRLNDGSCSWLSDCNRIALDMDKKRHSQKYAFVRGLRLWELRQLIGLVTAVVEQESADAVVPMIPKSVRESKESNPNQYLRKALPRSPRSDGIIDANELPPLAWESPELHYSDVLDLSDDICHPIMSPLVDLVIHEDYYGLAILLAERQRHTCHRCEQSALCWAGTRLDLKAMELLLQAGVDPDADLAIVAPSAGSSQERSLVSSDLRLVTAKARRLANYEATSGYGYHARVQGQPLLVYLAKTGALSAVTLLLEHGASTRVADLQGFTALHHACTQAHLLIIATLLSPPAADVAPADVNQVTVDGKTPLMLACEQRSFSAVSMLLSRSVNCAALDLDGNTALHHACGTAQTANAEIITLLLSANVEIGGRNVEGWTPLHFASYQGHIAAIKLLLDAGADHLCWLSPAASAPLFGLCSLEA
ncbi:ankyrin repeat [Recurvomyces mirabilis]|nr:ankyrin repeat [Recurvomyces mirabilis]